MAVDELSFQYGGTASWDAVTTALAEVDDSIPVDVDRAIRRVAEVVVERARERVMAEPTHARKHTGLRARIAAGTEATPMVGGGVEISASMDGNAHNLPLDMDEGGWMHPVYGNQREWVTQDGYFSWFTDTMDQSEGSFESAVENVLDQAIDKIKAS